MMTRNQLIHTSAIKYICSPSHLRPCKQWKEQPIERKRNGENKTARRETTTYTHAHTLIQRENPFNRKMSEGNQNTPYLTQFWILHTITHTHTVHTISAENFTVCQFIYWTQRYGMCWIEVASIEGNSQYLLCKFQTEKQYNWKLQVQ